MTGVSELIASKLFDEIAGAVFHGALDRFLKQQRAVAREEIMRQLKLGRHWAIQDDDAAAVMFGYLRAVQEGAARVNLRMIAEALFTGAQEPIFVPNEFLRHAASLAGLTRDEILFLAAFIQANRDATSQPGDPSDPTKRSMIAWSLMLKPSDTSTTLDVIAHAAALGRTGWVVPVSVYGGLTYYTTSIFDAVARLVDFERVKMEMGK